MENYIYEEELLNPLNVPKSYTYNYSSDNYDELYMNNNTNNENNKLKNEIKKLNTILNQKNKEIEENRTKYDNQLIQINKTFDNHIMEYQQLVQKYKNIQKELKMVQNELQQKNNLIQNINQKFSYNNSQDKKILQFLQIIKDKIKNIYFSFFNEENNEGLNNNIINILQKFENIFNQNNNIELKFKTIIQFINSFSQELSQYKINLNNSSNNNANNLFQKFYLEFIDIMNNFISNISFNFFNFNDFPKFSLNDNDEKKI